MRKSEDMDSPNPPLAALLRYIRGISNSKERAVVDQWLDGSVENREILDSIDLVYNTRLSRERIGARDSQAALKRVLWRIRANRTKKVLSKVCVAASLVVGLTGSFFWIREYAGSSSEPTVTTLTSAEGIRSRFFLPDGSEVCMNSGSTLSWSSDFGKDRREVSVSGEAFFDVTHDGRKPFVVNAGDGKTRITVLGTEFNLSAYPDDSLVQTTLVSGSIRMDFPDRGFSIQVSPEEKITYDLAAGKITREKTDTYSTTAWTEGKLVFRDTPMPEVFRQLSHFYGVDFGIADPEVLSWSFTGTFRNVSLPQILEYLRISSDLSYRTEGNEEMKIRIIVSKETAGRG